MDAFFKVASNIAPKRFFEVDAVARRVAAFLLLFPGTSASCWRVHLGVSKQCLAESQAEQQADGWVVGLVCLVVARVGNARTRVSRFPM